MSQEFLDSSLLNPATIKYEMQKVCVVMLILAVALHGIRSPQSLDLTPWQSLSEQVSYHGHKTLFHSLSEKIKRVIETHFNNVFALHSSEDLTEHFVLFFACAFSDAPYKKYFEIEASFAEFVLNFAFNVVITTLFSSHKMWNRRPSSPISTDKERAILKENKIALRNAVETYMKDNGLTASEVRYVSRPSEYVRQQHFVGRNRKEIAEAMRQVGLQWHYCDTESQLHKWVCIGTYPDVWRGFQWSQQS